MAEALRIKPSSKKVFTYRLYSLIIDGGALVYRKVFTEYAIKMSGSVSDHLEKYKPAIKRHLNRTQLDTLFKGGKPVNSVDACDVTLLAFLVSNTFEKEPANESLRQQISDLNELKMFRNEIVHIKSTEEYDRRSFEKAWQKLKVRIMRLGQGETWLEGLEEEIDALKEEPIEADREAELLKQIEDLKRKATSIEEYLTKEIYQLKINQQTMKEKMESNQSGLMAKMNDAAMARKRGHNELLGHLKEMKSSSLQLPGPGDFHREQSTYARAVQDSSGFYAEHELKHKRKDKKTGVTFVSTLHRTVAKGTVTAFTQTDYEDFSKVIGSKWQTVAKRLSLSKKQIDSIETKFGLSDTQAYIEKMALIWEDMILEKATIDRFIEAVVGCLKMDDGKMSVIEGIKGRHCETE